MTKFMMMLLVAVATIGTVQAIDLADCKTATDYRTYCTEQAVEDANNSNIPFYKMYADRLENPTDFTTFDSCIAKIASYIDTPKNKVDDPRFYGLFLYRTLYTPAFGFYEFRVDAYEYIKANNSDKLLAYLLHDGFCEEQEITEEIRFNGLVKCLLTKKYGVIDIQKALTKLADMSYAVDDDVIVNSYKKLYRKFYPQITAEDKTLQTVVDKITATLETYK